MRRLLAATPDDQLDDRFPGRVAATIGPSGLSHPERRSPSGGRSISASTALSGVGVVSEPGPGAASLPVRSVYLITDGTPAAQERARTQATTVLPRAIVHTQQDRELRETRFWNDRRTVIRLGTLFIVLVAACSLTVSAIGSLIERRRPFALLRASGVRLGELRSILLLETGRLFPYARACTAKRTMIAVTSISGCWPHSLFSAAQTDPGR